MTPKSTWKETLTFTDTGECNADNAQETIWQALWTVGTESGKSEIPEQTHFVRVTASKSASKAIPSANELRVPGFAVTTRPELQEIMLHEFCAQTSINAGLQDWSFWPEPLRRFLRTLTPQQRKWLSKYDEKKLVVFISMRGVREDHPMYADNSPKKGAKRMQILANADFSLFRCSKRGHQVVLEVHTEYFCVNTNNGDTLGIDTPHFIDNAYPSMDPNGRSPWRLLLTAHPHEYCIYFGALTDSRSYSVTVQEKDKQGHPVLDPDGKPKTVTTTVGPQQSIMTGNFIHGGINTVGCWMLFRNYNWPWNRRAEFLSIYVNDFRPLDPWEPIVKRKLRSLGYDVMGEADDWSSSSRKFVAYDQNYAYAFFCNRVLGVDFYSRADGVLDAPNLYEAHGCTQSVQGFTQEEKSFKLSRRFAPNGPTFDYYEKEESATIPNSVWKDKNVFDYPTAKGWGKVWAECFLFNPDKLSLAKLKANPLRELPHPIPDPGP